MRLPWWAETNGRSHSQVDGERRTGAGAAESAAKGERPGDASSSRLTGCRIERALRAVTSRGSSA